MDRATPSFAAPTDGWFLLKGDAARDGLSPDAAPTPIHEAWSFDVGTSVTGSAVESGGVVYAAGGAGTLDALSAVNGTLLWSLPLGGPVLSGLALARGEIFAATTTPALVEVNITDHNLTRSIPLPNEVSPPDPLPLGDVVLEACENTELCEYSLTDGARVWNVSLGGAVTASPAVSGSTVVVGTDGGLLEALDLATGDLLWQYTMPAGAPITSSPVISGSWAYAVSDAGPESGTLVAINLSCTDPCTPRYTEAVAGETGASPDVGGGLIVLANAVGAVQEYQSDNGSTVWSTTVSGSPLVASPIDADGQILIGTAEGDLKEVNATDGDVTASLALGTGLDASVAVTNSALYLGGTNGELFAIGLTPPSAPLDLKVTGANRSLLLSWAPPADDGGVARTGYSLTVDCVGSTPAPALPLPANLTSYTAQVTDNGALCTIDLAAVNGEGMGPAAVNSTTPEAVPFPPQDAALTVRDHKIVVNWSAPADDGGLPLTSYSLMWGLSAANLNHSVSLSTATHLWGLSALTDGIAVYVRVAALNALGAGPSTRLLSGAPYLANAHLVVGVLPAKAAGVAKIVVNGSTLDVASGAATVTLVPGSYWIYGNATGYLPYDEQVTLTAGNTTWLNVTFGTPAVTTVLGISDTYLEVAAAAVILVGVLLAVVLLRRRATAPERPAEDEEEEPTGAEEEEPAAESLKPSKDSSSSSPRPGKGPTQPT